jgi:hypothetical protein
MKEVSLDLNDVMTCFHASTAMSKSSENSLNDDSNDNPIYTKKHIYIYYS